MDLILPKAPDFKSNVRNAEMKNLILALAATLLIGGLASQASAESIAARADPKFGVVHPDSVADDPDCGTRVKGIEDTLKAGHALIRSGKVSEYRKHRRAEKTVLKEFRAECGEVDVRWKRIRVGSPLMLATGLEITGEKASSLCYGLAGRIRALHADHLHYAKKAETGEDTRDGRSARSEAADRFELLKDNAKRYRDSGCGDVSYDVEEADF
ncbi:MAG: hypothetical protein VX152_11265 [Pseudomonadota bacterium]|nr:hypothetical protein [Pseudomonadota bacterium]